MFGQLRAVLQSPLPNKLVRVMGEQRTALLVIWLGYLSEPFFFCHFLSHFNHFHPTCSHCGRVSLVSVLV